MLLILTLLLLGTASVFAQNISSVAGNITSKLKQYFTGHPDEDIYMQFDKSYYAAGDTIYFKVYVTMGQNHLLSDLSGVVYVDLIGPAGKINKSLKLRAADGLCWGDLPLEDTLIQGHYQIRAYTKLMLSEGSDNFFLRDIPVGSLPNGQKSVAVIRNEPAKECKSDFQFFSEGGDLLAGVRCKIAFKAIDTTGHGINVQGVVTDDRGKNICSFSASHLGMGFFYLKPENGRTYKASLTFADGTTEVLPLPKPDSNGVALNVNNDSIVEATIRITANDSYYAQNKGRLLCGLIYSGGKATAFTLKLDSPVIQFEVLKRHLQTGVATFTLFSSVGEPLCERLFFVQNYNWLNVAISTDKAQYAPRAQVHVTMHITDRAGRPATGGGFSVAVIDETKVPMEQKNEHTILTDLLLSSDLKGYVEAPDYYFENHDEKAVQDLDLVMLTHGYRRFEWEKVINGNKLSKNIEPEAGLDINGYVRTLFNKPVKNGSVFLIPQSGGKFLTTTTDEKGNFCFRNLAFTGSMNFVLNAVNAKGKDKTKIAYTPFIPPPVSRFPYQTESDVNKLMPVYLENSLINKEQADQYSPLNAKMLKEVTIKGSKPVQNDTRYGFPDKVIPGYKIPYGGQLSVRIAGLIHFHQYFNKPVLVVWNGVEMPRNFNINEIPSGSVTSIEAFTDGTAMGPDYENILIINTSYGLQPKDMIATGVLPIKVEGFYKVRAFYAPKYGGSSGGAAVKDMRTTVYWIPDIKTNEKGDTSFSFYNPDGKDKYRIAVEGIDGKGNLGSQICRYEIN